VMAKKKHRRRQRPSLDLLETASAQVVQLAEELQMYIDPRKLRITELAGRARLNGIMTRGNAAAKRYRPILADYFLGAVNGGVNRYATAGSDLFLPDELRHDQPGDHPGGVAP